MTERYTIAELTPISANTRVFSVTAASSESGESVQVWWSGTSGNCTGCQGPRSAMLSSCKHVAAVKRHLSLAKKPDAVPAALPITAAALTARAQRLRQSAAEFIVRAEQYEKEAAGLSLPKLTESKE